MEQNSTPLFFNSQTWLRTLILSLILLVPVMVKAQTAETIFRETVGANPLSNVDVYETNHYFDNDNLTMSSTTSTLAAVANADPSNYPGASSAHYINLASDRNFIISGINTAKYTSVKLDFGVKVGSGTTLKVEYQSNGGAWQTLNYILPSSKDGWQYISGETGALPSSSNISIKFTASPTNNRPGNLFIDDISLSGIYSPTEPEVSGFSPASGGPGTEVTVYGYNLGNTYDVYFPTSGSIALATYVSSDSIKFTVPADAETSLIELYDENVNLIATTSEKYVVVRAVINSFTPDEGSPFLVGINGTEVVITGTNLSTSTSVVFGGAGSAIPHYATDTEVRVYVPDAAETGALVVKTSTYGDATSSTVFTVNKPKITSLTSTTGATKNSGKVGETVVIKGERLDKGPVSVIFGGDVAATDVTIISASELRVVIPNGAQTGLITVNTTEGTATSTTFTVLYPSITIQNTPLSSFTAKVGSASEIQFYVISGSNLSDNIIIEAPASFQVSKDGITWATGISYAIDGSGTVGQQYVYVRYLPAAKGTHTGNITNSSSGLSELISVEGSTVEPTITVDGTLNAFDAQINTASASQSFTVSGAYLDSDITIDAPENFEVSLDNQTFKRQEVLSLPQGSTSIAATPVYVRYFPASEGSHNGEVTHTSTNAATVPLAVSGSVSSSTLPVELISFTAEQKAGSTVFNWSTASEKDNKYFEIEASANPKAGFKTIAQVNSKVTNSAVVTNYTYNTLITAGTHYFRLKQVDLDGTFSYSKIIAIEIANSAAQPSVVVAPNPLNFNSKVYINAERNGKAILHLTSLAGKQVYFKDVIVSKGENEIQLPLYNKLTNGVYILSVEVDGKRQQVKVVKQ